MSDLVCVKISGLNLLRIVDGLVKKNVFVSDVVTKQKYIKFVISEKDLPVLDKICKKERKFYTIIYKNGFKMLLSKMPYMLGTFLALVLTTIFIYSYSLFVFSVKLEYSSNLPYDLKKVNQVLLANGIVSGMKKKKFKTSDISNLIMLSVDDVEGCNVRFNGNVLKITIYPAIKKHEISSENIYSKFDGVVESAESFSGKLKVKAGDIVKKGDILIENDNGASGKVFGKVYFTATKIYNEKQQKISYTGKTFSIKDFLVMGKWEINSKAVCPFKKYEVINKSYYVSKNLFLPILCRERLYKEIEIGEIIVPFSDVEEKIKNEVFEQAKLKISDESAITNVTYSTVFEGGYTRVDCFVETLISLI